MRRIQYFEDLKGELSPYLSPFGAGLALIATFLPWLKYGFQPFVQNVSGADMRPVFWVVLLAVGVIEASYIYFRIKDESEAAQLRIVKPVILSCSALAILVVAATLYTRIGRLDLTPVQYGAYLTVAGFLLSMLGTGYLINWDQWYEDGSRAAAMVKEGRLNDALADANRIPHFRKTILEAIVDALLKQEEFSEALQVLKQLRPTLIDYIREVLSDIHEPRKRFNRLAEKGAIKSAESGDFDHSIRFLKMKASQQSINKVYSLTMCYGQFNKGLELMRSYSSHRMERVIAEVASVYIQRGKPSLALQLTRTWIPKTEYSNVHLWNVDELLGPLSETIASLGMLDDVLNAAKNISIKGIGDWIRAIAATAQARTGSIEDALATIQLITRRGLGWKLQGYSLVFITGELVRSGKLTEATKIAAIKNRWGSEERRSVIVKELLRQGQLDQARKLARSEQAYVVVKAILKADKLDEAEQLARQYPDEEYHDEMGLAAVSCAYAEKGQKAQAVKVAALIKGTAGRYRLARGMAHLGRFDEALEIVQQMKEKGDRSYLYGDIIEATAEAGFHEKALAAVELLKSSLNHYEEVVARIAQYVVKDIEVPELLKILPLLTDKTVGPGSGYRVSLGNLCKALEARAAHEITKGKIGNAQEMAYSVAPEYLRMAILAGIVRQLAEERKADEIERIIESMSLGSYSKGQIYNAATIKLAECGHVDLALKMSKETKDVKALVAAFINLGLCDLAIKVFDLRVSKHHWSLDEIRSIADAIRTSNTVDELLKLGNSYSEVKYRLAGWILGCAGLAACGRIEEALHVADTICTVDEEQSSVLKIDLLLRSGRTEEAVKIAKSLVSPKYGLRRIAVFLARAGQVQPALDLLELSLSNLAAMPDEVKQAVIFGYASAGKCNEALSLARQDRSSRSNLLSEITHGISGHHTQGLT